MTPKEIFKSFFTAPALAMIALFLTYFIMIFNDKKLFFEYYSAKQEAAPVLKISKPNTYEINTEYIKIKFPPEHQSFSAVFSADDITKDLLKVGISKHVSLIFRDEQYCYANYKWFNSYSSWWINFIELNCIEFAQDGFDCDNFSDLFMALYSLSSKNSNNRPKAQLICGTLVVENAEEFAGILAKKNSWHSLNIVWTDFGWFVIEPQNGTFISIRSYPNKNNIKAIIF